jgi:hypothetical protein
MQVRQGWSGEIRPSVWAKFDVELDEEDLRRILMAHPRYDAGVAVSLPVAYKLLELEAERLVTLKLAHRYGYDAEAAAETITKLGRERGGLLTQIYPSAEDAASAAVSVAVSAAVSTEGAAV